MSITILDSVKNVRDFMLGDLNKTADIDKSHEGGPNFLLALALCSYTEYWGKLITENKMKSIDSFNSFFVRLGDCYGALVKEYGGKIYRNVRCGLAHAFLIEKSAVINMRRGPYGIEYDRGTGHYAFNVKTYLEDFERAVNTYLC